MDSFLGKKSKSENSITMKSVALFIGLFWCSLAYSQQKFQWFEGSTLYTAVFDTTKYNYEQISSIYNSFVQVPTRNYPFLAFSPAEINELSIPNLEEFYADQFRYFSQAEIPKDSFWIAVKKEFDTLLKQELYLKKQLILSYTNPKRAKFSCCETQVKIIQQKGKKLLQAWDELHRSQLHNATDSLFLVQEHTIKRNSRDCKKWAQIELISFGLWNCILERLNELISKNQDEIHQAFELFFTSIEKTESK